jgi:hypothetical protein
VSDALANSIRGFIDDRDKLQRQLDIAVSALGLIRNMEESTERRPLINIASSALDQIERAP